MASIALAEQFCRGIPEGAARPPASEELGLAVEALLARARVAWPDLAIPDGDFIQFLAARWDSSVAMSALHAEDLYLALACSRSQPRALEALERLHFGKLSAVMPRTGDIALEDVQQALREKLLVRRGELAPRIGEYAGRGPLLHWIRAAAVRTAQDLARQRKQVVSSPDQVLEELPSPELGAELALIKERHRGEFKAAFEEAMASLSAKDRNLLRLYFVDELTPDEIGRVYGVHRVTVWRWITRCQDELFDATRRSLVKRLPVSATEFESLLQDVRSNLDVRISLLLRG